MSAKFVPATTMKNAIAHCVAGANGSIERASVENPAVAIVGERVRDGAEQVHVRIDAGPAEQRRARASRSAVIAT